MSEISSRTHRSALGRGARRRTHPTSPVAKQVMQTLSETSVPTVVTVLSEMLFDTSDQTTRTAILDTRVQVLHARINACRLGKSVDHQTTLFELLGDKSPRTAPLNVLSGGDEPASPETDAEQTERSETMVQIRLLENYTHQGFDLPIGAVFAAPKDDADQLIEKGVSEVYAPEPVSDETEVEATEPEEETPDETKPVEDTAA
jgi:hypothetical protein